MERAKPLSSNEWVAAAVMAPIAMSPSRAMFTTPERSQIMPPAAAIRIGATIMRAEGIIFIVALKKSLILGLLF
jgi:hypothetical protein